MFTRQRLFFGLVVLFCLSVLYPVLFPMALGLVLAYLCEDAAQALQQRLGLHGKRARGLVAFGLVTLVQILFIVPLFLLTWSAFQELFEFWQGVSGDATALETGLKALHWLDSKVTPLLQSIGLHFSFDQMRTKLQESIQPLLQGMAVYVGGLLSSTPRLILFFTVSWMSWIYFLIYGREQRAEILPQLLPFEEERNIIAQSLGEVLRAMVLTSIVLALVQSFLVFASLGLVGVPKFYLWGALSFFLSFIPVFGTAPVMLSAAGYLYNQGRLVAAGFVVLMAVVIGLADNVVRPLMMKGGSDLSFFWLFLGLVGGIAMFGLPGAILGPWAFTLFVEARGRVRN